MMRTLSSRFRKLISGMLALAMMTSIVAPVGNIAHAAPVSTKYLDLDGDGTVDHVKIHMLNTITSCTFEGSDWNISNAGSINIMSIDGLAIDPEGNGDGSCDGTDTYVYLGVTAGTGITGGAVNPIISYNNIDADNSISGAIPENYTIYDATAPIIAVVTPIPLSTPDTTPEFSISISESIIPSIVTFSGSCAADFGSPMTSDQGGGVYSITALNPLDLGTYSDCSITLRDTALNISNILSLTSFTIRALQVSDRIDCSQTGTTMISETECNALLDIYFDTNGNTWSNDSYWNTMNDVASWQGITLSGGYVTEISLVGNSLSGTIPSSIANLSHLTRLDLSNNSISGTIPSELWNLINLEYLNLSINPFTAYSLPVSINNLTQLTELDLSMTSLTGSLVDISSLTNIVRIVLSNNSLVGGAEYLWNLGTLTELDIRDNHFIGTLPNDIGTTLPNMRYLSLNLNSFTGSIPTSLAENDNLLMLAVNDNHFSGVVPHFSGATLVNVYVNRNDFTFADLEPNFLLNDFDLGSGFVKAPQNNIDTTRTENYVEGDTVTISSVLANSPNNVYTWKKDGITLTGETLSGLTIASAALSDSGVYTYEVTNTEVTGLTLISHPITVNVTLPALDCSDTARTGVDQIECEALVDLYDSTDGDNWNVKTNWKTATNVGTWAGITAGLGHIRGISLGNSDQALSGSLNSSLGDLTYLTYLGITDNPNLVGSIPSTINNLIHLQYLNLNDNALSGNIPTINALTSLDELRLNNNNLTGNIPDISALSGSLDVLNLGNNNLTGNIPSYLNTFNNSLYSLNLSYNSLTGAIPDLSNVSFLTYLYIDGNNLSGEVPDFSSPMINRIYLSENRFTFADLKTHFVSNSGIGLGVFNPTPQQNIGATGSLVYSGAPLTISSVLVADTDNHYVWKKNGISLPTETGSSLSVTSSGVYTYEVTNDVVTGLTLISYPITVTDFVNSNPSITSASSISVNENQTAVITVTATDVDAGQTLTYSLSGGADVGKFAINPTTGVLTFISAPNYESPTDSDTNNTYVVIVKVVDNHVVPGVTTQTITVTVNNVSESSSGGGGGGSYYYTTTTTTSTGIINSTSTGATSTGTTNTDTTDDVTTEETTPTFSDIDDSFARDYIETLADLGIVSGYPDGTFRPENPATRAEFLKMVMNALEIAPLVDVEASSFSDVSVAWQLGYTEKAKTLGIVTGQEVDGKLIFRPNDSITRAEALKILFTAAKIAIDTSLTSSQFSDVTIAWQIPYVEKAKLLGIISGQMKDGKLIFRPNDSITRAELAKILVNTLGL